MEDTETRNKKGCSVDCKQQHSQEIPNEASPTAGEGNQRRYDAAFTETKVLCKAIHGKVSLVRYHTGVVRVVKTFYKTSLCSSGKQIEGMILK